MFTAPDSTKAYLKGKPLDPTFQERNPITSVTQHRHIPWSIEVAKVIEFYTLDCGFFLSDRDGVLMNTIAFSKDAGM